MSVIIVPTIKIAPGHFSKVVELLQSDMFPYTDSESGNGSYFFFRSTGDGDSAKITGTDTLSAFEEYASQSVCDGHVKSEALAAFGKKLSEGGLTSGEIQLNYYTPSNGFLTRDSATPEGHRSSSGGSFIWIARLACASASARSTLLESAKPLIRYVHDNEPDTLSYMFTSARDNDTDVLVFEQYATKAALFDVHHHSDAFKEFFGVVREKGLVVAKETSGFETIANGGWLAKDGLGANRL